MNTNPFNYKNLEAGPVRHGNHYAYSNRSFHQLIPTNFNEESLSGWKLHVSVSREDVAESWDSLLPVFEKNGLVAKVAKPETADAFSSPDSPQRGKMITIYFTDQKEHASVVEEIEETLRSSGIKRGTAVAGDRPLEGSDYVYYRNDRNADGQYISAASAGATASAHNPENAPDPFEGVVVGTPGNRLNMFAEQAGLNGQWEKDAGHGTTGIPNRRIFLPPEQAELAHEALVQQGIPATLAQKGEAHLVVVPIDEQTVCVPFENYHKAIQHHEALLAKEQLNNREGSPEWYVDPGRGATGQPNLRTEVASPYDAAKLADDMALRGVKAEPVQKGDSFLVRILPEDLPKEDNEPFRPVARQQGIDNPR